MRAHTAERKEASHDLPVPAPWVMFMFMFMSHVANGGYAGSRMMVKLHPSVSPRKVLYSVLVRFYSYLVYVLEALPC